MAHPTEFGRRNADRTRTRQSQPSPVSTSSTSKFGSKAFMSALFALSVGAVSYQFLPESELSASSRPTRFFLNDAEPTDVPLRLYPSWTWGATTRQMLTASEFCKDTAKTAELTAEWNSVEQGKGDYILYDVRVQLEKGATKVGGVLLDSQFCSTQLATFYRDAQILRLKAEKLEPKTKYAAINAADREQSKRKIAELDAQLARVRGSAASVSRDSGEQYPSFSIAEMCRAKWPRDYSMEEYCQKQQEDARSWARGRNIETRIAVECARRWSEDWSMYAYCVKKEEEARDKLGG